MSSETFRNYGDLTSALAFAVIDRFAENETIDARFGKSERSCSAYVDVTFWSLDADGDPDEELGQFRLRFSDHADKYGADAGFDVRDHTTDITDEGEWVEVIIPADAFAELVNEGEKAIRDAFALVAA